jgi:hypothetical protein
MARTLEPVARASRVVFELDRFELVNDDQYELQGRWFGVRGRRFIRPTLTVTVDEKPVRLLADLDHKPWAAEDGQPWVAAFPTRFEGEVQHAELTVAPDITIELRAPGARPAGKRRTRSAPDVQRKPTQRRAEGGDAAALSPESDDAVALGRKLADARQRQHELQRQLDRAEADRARAAARMDELLGNLSAAMHEREQAQADRDQALARVEELVRENTAGAAEREAAIEERDSARQERGAALQMHQEALAGSAAAAEDRDQAQAQRDAALAAQARAESERDTALQAQAQAEADSQVAHMLRDQAQAERDEALAATEQAIQERESIRDAIVQLNSEVAHNVSSRGAAMVMRRAVQEPASFRTHAPLLPRALAIILLMAVVVVLLIVLHVA